MKRSRLLALVMLLFTGSLSMVCCATKGQLSRQRAAALEREIASLQRELQSERQVKQQYAAMADGLRAEEESLKRQVEDYKAELRTPDVVSVRECEAKLKGCRELRSEAEKKAYVTGMLDVWQSLSVSAIPEESGWLVKDYYLSFCISVKNKPVFTCKVQTSSSESGFSKTFSRMADAASIVAIMIPK